jgi:hypothetical protein
MRRKYIVYIAVGALVVVIIASVVLLADLHVALRSPQAPQRHSGGQLVVAAAPSASSASPSVSGDPAASAGAPAPSPQLTPPPAQTSPITPTAAPSGVGQESVPVIYDRTGQGNLVTEDFQVPAQWIIYWSYACPNADAAAGRLAIGLYRQGVDSPLKSFSNQAAQSRGQEYNYVGDGWYHLSLQTACSWRITVTPAPGFSASATPTP